MRPPRRLGLLRAWVRRVLAGAWTHAGYLNWDTGLGFHRWHQRKKVPLAQQALLGIAAEPELWPGESWGPWAKWLLDRGLEHYADLADREGAIPGPLAYGVNVLPQTRGDAVLAAARTAANAMRALDAGLRCAPGAGAARAVRVRPGHGPARDHDARRTTRRSCPTTAARSRTAVSTSRGCSTRGRSRSRTSAGRPPAAFGVVVRARGRVVLATQDGARHTAIRGVAAHPSARRAYAGPFTALRVSGTARAGARSARSAYRFTPTTIDARWTVKADAGDRVAATFPSWGAATALIATLTDGTRVQLDATPLPLARIARLEVGSGYTITPRGRAPGGATVRAVPTRPQSSAPTPGPSIEVQFTGELAVRLSLSAGDL